MNGLRNFAAGLMICVLGSVLSAQATLNLTGTADDAKTRVHKVLLDYGGNAQPLTLDMQVTTTSSDGIDIEMYDLAAQLGGSSSTAGLFLTGAGSDSNSLATAARTGVQEFFITVMPWGFGSSDYDLTISVTGVSQADLTDGGAQTFSNNSGNLSKIHNRAFFYYGDYWSGGTDEVRFKVDFGVTTQAISAAFEFDAGFDITGLRVYEENPGGTDTLLYDGGANPFSGLVLLNTTSRSGEVVFRVEGDIGSNGSVLEWNILFPTSVTPVGRVGGASNVATSGGESSDGGGGCVAGNGSTTAMLILVGLVVVAGALRMRRA